MTDTNPARQTIPVQSCMRDERPRLPRQRVRLTTVSYGPFTYGDEVTVEFFVARAKRAKSWELWAHSIDDVSEERPRVLRYRLCKCPDSIPAKVAAEDLLQFAWRGDDWWGCRNLCKVLHGGLIKADRVRQLILQSATA